MIQYKIIVKGVDEDGVLNPVSNREAACKLKSRRHIRTRITSELAA